MAAHWCSSSKDAAYLCVFGGLWEGGVPRDRVGEGETAVGNQASAHAPVPW